MYIIHALFNKGLKQYVQHKYQTVCLVGTIRLIDMFLIDRLYCTFISNFCKQKETVRLIEQYA